MKTMHGADSKAGVGAEMAANLNPADNKQSVQLQCAICENTNLVQFHYGTFACNGCRTFYRNAVRKGCGSRWLCSMNGKCPVDLNRSCRKCRLDKCVEAGIRPEAVQQRRDPIRNACRVSEEVFQAQLKSRKLKRGLFKSTTETSDLQHATTPLMGAEVSRCAAHELAQSSHSIGLPMLEPTILYVELQSSAAHCSTINCALNYERCWLQEMTTALLKFRESRGIPDGTIVSHLHFSGFRFKQELSQVLIATAIPLITAAKQDSDYCALPLADQIALIRGMGWTTLLINVAKSEMWTNSRIAARKILFPPENQMHFDEDLEDAICGVVVPAIAAIPLDEISVALLRSIAFWNVELCSKISRPVVSEKRTQCIAAMEHHMRTNFAAAPGSVGRLLMLLKSIDKLASASRQWWAKNLSNPEPLVQEVYLNPAEFQD